MGFVSGPEQTLTQIIIISIVSGVELSPGLHGGCAHLTAAATTHCLVRDGHGLASNPAYGYLLCYCLSCLLVIELIQRV